MSFGNVNAAALARVRRIVPLSPSFSLFAARCRIDRAYCCWVSNCLAASESVGRDPPRKAGEAASTGDATTY